MALNAHMAIFQDLTTPDAAKPTASSDEATSGFIRGTSSIIPGLGPEATDGEPSPPAHVEWIQLDGIRFQVRHDGLSYPIVEIRKQRDIASPLLAKHCCSDTVFASAKILVLSTSGSAGGANEIQEVIRMYQVRIESVQAVFGSNADQLETAMLRYEQILWTCGNSEHGWDHSARADWYGPDSEN